MSKAPNQVGTSTINTAPPAYVQAAQQNLLNTADNLTRDFTSNAPNFALAGFTPDQEMAFDLARYMGQQAYTNAAPNIPFNATTWNIGYNPGLQATPSQGTATNAVDYGLADRDIERVNPSLSNAAQLDAQGIRSLFNPYQQDVVDTTTQQLEEANARQLNAIKARQAAEGAYGGNRGALQETEQNRNFGNTLANTIAGLNNAGWNTAAQLGMQNTGLQQGTNLANQAAQNQAALTNKQAQNQISLANQAARNQIGLANAQAQNQMAAFNAAQQNQVGEFNAQMGLNAANLQNTTANADWQRQMQALQSLLGTGATQQQFAQQAIDVPFTELARYAGYVPGNYGSSQATPIYGPNTLQTLLPFLGLGAAALSDETTKKDKQKLGKDPATKLDMYAFRYKGEPANAPKTVGPMAQQVEQKYPGATARVGGKMVIKGAARKLLGI